MKKKLIHIMILSFFVFFNATTSLTSPGSASAQSLTNTPTRTPTPINIGNFVWDDLDQDGTQDAGEPGLAGVSVQLWNAAKNQLINSTSTSASGSYNLVAPISGNYRVRVVLPSASDAFSPKDAAVNDQTDSDINPSGVDLGFTDTFNIASNVISTTIYDAGIIKFKTPTPTRTPTPINIGNFVWHDLNGNGIQDAGEPGIAGMTVQLWNAAKNNLIFSAVTDANGKYAVIAPVPGDYRVRVVPFSGSSFSPKNQGADDTKDSDINASIISADYGFSDIFTIATNVISTTIYDAGLSIVGPTLTPTRTRTPTPVPGNTSTPSPTPDNNTLKHTISGNVKLAGVTLKYTDGTAKTATSNSSGNYSFTVSYHWNGTVTPSKAGIPSFYPASRAYTNLASNQSNQNFRPTSLKAFTSIAAQDGYVRESTENSNVGGALNASSTTLLVGDAANKSQYRSIFSFDTSTLPDTAKIVAVRLKLTLKSIVGTNPFSTHGSLLLDIRKPYFGTAASLGLNDFAATAGVSSAGTVNKTPAGKVYTGSLISTGLPGVNLTGVTQLRMRFSKDDDNDSIADYLAFYSANEITSAYKPVLQVIYYIP